MQINCHTSKQHYRWLTVCNAHHGLYCAIYSVPDVFAFPFFFRHEAIDVLFLHCQFALPPFLLVAKQ